MNSRPKIYVAESTTCVARSYRALKRAISKGKVRASKFYTYVGHEQVKKSFEVYTIERHRGQKPKTYYRIRWAAKEE